MSGGYVRARGRGGEEPAIIKTLKISFFPFFSIPSLREPVALQKIYAFTLYPACSFLLTASSMSAFTLRRLALARLAGVAVGNGRGEAQRARGGRATAPVAAAIPSGPRGPC